MSETVDILGTHALRLAFERALLPAWAARGESHRISWGVSNTLAEQIIGGLRGDVVVLSDAWMERFARDGIIDPATLRPLAQARIGIGVRAGENLPTIETVEQLVAVLRSSCAVAWSRRGASGFISRS